MKILKMTSRMLRYTLRKMLAKRLRQQIFDAHKLESTW